MNSLKRASCLLIVAVMLFSMFVGTALTSSAATPLAHKVQLDTEWKSVYVGGASLYKTGCGIFSLSNAVGYLTGKRIDITTAAKWAHSIGGFNVNGGDGTYRLVLYPKVQAKYGATYGFTLNCNGGQGWWAGSSSSLLKSHLANGGVAIGHVPGHFIALVDYDYGTNKFHVLDSAPSTARGTTSGRGDCWVTQSRLATGKLKLDWFCLLSATGTPADEQDNEKGLLATAISNAEDKRYDQYTESGVASLRTAYKNAVDVYNNTSSTSDNYKTARTALEAAMKSATNSIISTGKSYTVTNTFNTAGEQADDGKKLTDGSKGNSDGGTNKFFGAKGTEIVVDLGSVQNSNIYKIYMTAGDWGVAVPWGDQLDLNVQVSNDGTNFTHVVSANNSIRTGVTNGNWQTLTLTANAPSTVSARFIKFTVTSYATNNFVWLDEVEVISGEPLLSGHVYVNGMNQKIGSGDCFVFTPKFGTITTDTANHAYTANIVAKWVEGNKYQVTAKTFGNGASTPSITLNSDEILIAANNWETGVTDGSEVKGSAANTNTLNGVQVGDYLYFDGIDSYNSELEVVAYVRLSSAATEAPAPETHQHTPGPVSCTADQVCLTCGDVLATALGHDSGEWETEENIKHLKCTKCGEVLDTEEIQIDGVGEEKPIDPDVSDPDVSDPDVSDPDNKPVKEKIGMYGDVNVNEKIDMTDYILVKRAYFGTYDLDEVQTILADINANNKIDMTDYILLKRVYFGTYTLGETIAYK